MWVLLVKACLLLVTHINGYTKQFLYRSVNSCIKSKFKDVFIQEWYAMIRNFPKSINYRLFIWQLLIFLEGKDLFTLRAFRTTNHNHKLPIETGQWNRIERGEQLCNTLNDSFHFITACPFLCGTRNKLINKSLPTRA